MKKLFVTMMMALTMMAAAFAFDVKDVHVQLLTELDQPTVAEQVFYSGEYKEKIVKDEKTHNKDFKNITDYWVIIVRYYGDVDWEKCGINVGDYDALLKKYPDRKVPMLVTEDYHVIQYNKKAKSYQYFSTTGYCGVNFKYFDSAYDTVMSDYAEADISLEKYSF